MSPLAPLVSSQQLEALLLAQQQGEDPVITGAHEPCAAMAAQLCERVQWAWMRVNGGQALEERTHMCQLWRSISKEVLSPPRSRRDVPFTVDQLLFR